MTDRTDNTAAGRLVVIAGPSGSGKTSVCRQLLKEPGVVSSVSATTRAPRPGERDGVEYHFMDRDAFERRADEGAFAEHAEYNGHLYGTPREQLEQAVAAGHTVLVEIDLQGVRQLQEVFPEATYVFLDAPDRETAIARLTGRKTETDEQCRQRIATADRERDEAKTMRFDYRVVNDKLDDTVDEIKNLIAGGTPAETTS